MVDENELRALIAQAEQAVEQGRRSEALTFVARAQAAAPRNPDVLAACGVLTLRAGDVAQAKVLIDAAVAGDSSLAHATDSTRNGCSAKTAATKQPKQ